MQGQIAYISVGSNMGAKLENCRRGIVAVTDHADIFLVAQSPFYRTEPVDFTDQEWFVNAVFSIETTRLPEDLLKVLQAIQREAGKRSSVRFGPRMLDLDILLYGGLIITTPSLTIPHPRMHQRRFVLQPLCDINRTLMHPVINREMGDLLDSLDDSGQQVVLMND